MILSNTVKVKYKLNVVGVNTVEMARILKDYSVSGFLITINERNIIVAVPREDIVTNREKVFEMISNLEG